jgi:thiamine-phosphate pyrophosphorylase
MSMRCSWRLFHISRYNAPTMSRNKRTRPLSGLYVILDSSVRPDRPPIDVLNGAAAAGVTIFQYRNKTASMKEAFGEALPLRNRARELEVLFLVNDRCDLTLALEADGVHLGQNDLPVAQARRVLGPETVIGLSTHNDGQVEAANRLQPDYIGFGPIFTPGSKTDHDPIVGIDALRRIRSLTRLPIFAIGGIHLGQVRAVIEAGADGIAVISALANAPDIEAAVSALLEQMP